MGTVKFFKTKKNQIFDSVSQPVKTKGDMISNWLLKTQFNSNQITNLI